MRNFKITFEYDGAKFCGWQTQAQGERTVQGELEAVISKVFKKPIKVIASGRTDSGVHAKGQVISFKADTRMKPLEIQRALNSYLPADIAVLEVKEVKSDFHAQNTLLEFWRWGTNAFSMDNAPSGQGQSKDGNQPPRSPIQLQSTQENQSQGDIFSKITMGSDGTLKILFTTIA